MVNLIELAPRSGEPFTVAWAAIDRYAGECWSEIQGDVNSPRMATHEWPAAALERLQSAGTAGRVTTSAPLPTLRRPVPRSSAASAVSRSRESVRVVLARFLGLRG